MIEVDIRRGHEHVRGRIFKASVRIYGIVGGGIKGHFLHFWTQLHPTCYEPETTAGIDRTVLYVDAAIIGKYSIGNSTF